MASPLTSPDPGFDPGATEDGITPITNLMPLPLTRSIEPDLELLPMERVENTARTRDETYSPSRQPSERGAEEDARGRRRQTEFEGSETKIGESCPAAAATALPARSVLCLRNWISEARSIPKHTS